MNADDLDAQSPDTLVGVPAFYADALQFFATPYTMGLGFAMREANNTLTQQVVVRTSPLHAKIIVMALHHHIKRWERELGVEIPVPPNVLDELGLSIAEDWGD